MNVGQKLKYKKPVGLDDISSEVLENESVALNLSVGKKYYPYVPII